MPGFLTALILIASTMIGGDVMHDQEQQSKKGRYEKSSSQTKGKNMELTTIGVIETSMGTIEIELHTADAPKTAKNFIELAKKGYYNGIIIHRIAKGFVIQTGDPTGTGSGGTSIYGGEFEDELDPKAPSFQKGYRKGTVAMANRGPNTNTSQFFIMLTDVPTMPKNYTIFGTVIAGMDVVEKIAAVPIRPMMGPTDGRPLQDIKMLKVTTKAQ